MRKRTQTFTWETVLDDVPSLLASAVKKKRKEKIVKAERNNTL